MGFEPAEAEARSGKQEAGSGNEHGHDSNQFDFFI